MSYNVENKSNHLTGLLLALFFSFAGLLFISTCHNSFIDNREDGTALHSTVNLSSVISSGTDNIVLQRLIIAPQESVSLLFLNKSVVIANNAWRNIDTRSIKHLLLSKPVFIIHHYHIFINDSDECPPLYL